MMEAEEAAIATREEQRNILEGYLYKLRDLLDHTHADDAQTKDLVEKRSSLE